MISTSVTCGSFHCCKPHFNRAKKFLLYKKVFPTKKFECIIMLVCSQPLQQRWLDKCIVSDLRNSVAVENSGGDKETGITKTASWCKFRDTWTHSSRRASNPTNVWVVTVLIWLPYRYLKETSQTYEYLNTGSISVKLYLSQGSGCVAHDHPQYITSLPRQYHCRRELWSTFLYVICCLGNGFVIATCNHATNNCNEPSQKVFL